MTRKSLSFATLILVIILVGALLLFGFLYGTFLWERALQIYRFFIDREKVAAFINSFGTGAPLVLIGIQFLQVLFAPLPGEATGGFIGGYLFGAGQGFLYSTLGLTAGSILAFVTGRFLGKRFVRRLIPDNQLSKLDTLVKHQGIFVLFVMFAVPGFPKDYLCLFLGVTAIPFKAFFLIATIGRLPGTFAWSLQGAFAYDQHYGLLALILIPFMGLGILAYRSREYLYRWVERINGNQITPPDPTE
jgi:uncharacterized membrane protein YdjX (TVP38/TMEM64 family)